MAAPWFDEAPDCGRSHPRGCHGHVEECIVVDCKWRGENYPGTPCIKCGGEVKRRPCRRAPALGGIHCDSHGAAAPLVKKKNAANLQRARALGEVGELMQSLRSELGEATTIESMEQALQITAGMMHVYRHQVEQLDLEPDVSEIVVGDGAKLGGQTGTRLVATNEALHGPNHLGDAAPHVSVVELHKWTRLHGDLTKNAISLNIEQRKSEIDQAKVVLLASVLQSVADGLREALLSAGAGDRKVIERVWSEQWPVVARQALAMASDLDSSS